MSAIMTNARGQEKRRRVICREDTGRNDRERARMVVGRKSRRDMALGRNHPAARRDFRPTVSRPSRPRKRGSAPRIFPKKYSPPYPLDTKGCCSPQNNPKKSSSLYWPRFQGISNDLFVDCTGRFSHISRKCIFFAISSQLIH